MLALKRFFAESLEPTLQKAAPDPLPLSKQWRRRGVAKRARDAAKLWEMREVLLRLGDLTPAAIELLTGAARPLLERWFEADVLRATLATDAIIGAGKRKARPIGKLSGSDWFFHYRHRGPKVIFSTSRAEARPVSTKLS